MLHKTTLGLLVLVSHCFFGLAAGDEVDVYFIVGQSNAINFAKEAGTGTTNVGFTLHFARTGDTFNDFPNHTGVATSFSSDSLNISRATSILARGLQRDGRDVAIFAFARNGAGLHLNESSDGSPWIWYPGATPPLGDLYNDSLYANAVSWNQTRMQELIDDGHTPTVKGLFWFQGEKDGRLGDHNLYKGNFDNLVYRFRLNYGHDLPIVATQIREVTETAANRVVINNSLLQAANEELLLDFVMTEDLEFRSATDVHLTGNGHAALASRWSKAMLGLQSYTVPESFVVTEGMHFSGGVAEITNSDDVDLTARRSNSDVASRVFIEFKGVSPSDSPSALSFTLEASVFARTNVFQRIDIWNFDDETWDEVDSRIASRLADSSVTVDTTKDLSRFVEPGTNFVRARARFDSENNPRQRFSVSVDQAIWSIE